MLGNVLDLKIIIIIVVMVIVALLLFRYNLHLKAKAKKCKEEAKRFHKEVQSLSATDRMFTDEELKKLKMKYSPLLDDVNSLYDSYFISNDFLDKLGLGDFLEERRLLNHTQYLNNKGHKA